MLSLSAFQDLTLPEQARYARAEGKYLAWRAVGRYRLHLYELSGYFVEIAYLGQSLTDLRTFISRKNLEPWQPFLGNALVE